MANSSKPSEVEKFKSAHRIIKDFTIHDTKEVRENLRSLLFDFMAIAPDEMLDSERRSDVINSYWAIDKLLESIESYTESVSVQIERRVG